MAPGDVPISSSLLLSPPGVGLAHGTDALTSRRPRATSEPGEVFPPLYRLLRLGCAPLLRRLFDLRVAGIERLPAAGPFIVAANHHNYLDGVVLGVALPRPIAFVVMPRVYNASPLHPLFHQRLGSIPVSLERPDPGAIRRVLRTLESGCVVGIFPEGPFSREGRLVPGQPGVAMIALRSGMPVVPAAIEGTYEALRGRRFYVPRRHRFSVRFGAPMHFGGARHRRVTRAERADVTRRIMEEIAALLGADGKPGAATDQAGTS
jgi:1-acyl-sn-glycerol-3-phosphate acyltransferase